MQNKYIQFIAKNIANLVNYNFVNIDIFRNLFFKGKLTISGHIKKEVFPKNAIFKCHCLLFDIDFNDEIQRYIYLNLYENQEIKLLRKYIKPGSCCFDIGANIGFFSLHMAKLTGASGKVFAFEPDTINFTKLNDNIMLNNYKNNIFPFRVGVSSESGNAIFSRTLNSNSGWGHIGEWELSQERLLIETITLDDFVSQNGIKNINFLKCDIEGHEFEFLKGADETLKAGIIDTILIEYCGYVLERKGYCVEDLLNVFKNYGYIPVLLNLKQLSEAEEFAVYNLFFTKKAA